jgi:hypothetical protein
MEIVDCPQGMGLRLSMGEKQPLPLQLVGYHFISTQLYVLRAYSPISLITQQMCPEPDLEDSFLPSVGFERFWSDIKGSAQFYVFSNGLPNLLWP